MYSVEGLYDITTYLGEVILKSDPTISPGDTYKQNESVIYDDSRDEQGNLAPKTSGANMFFSIDVQYELDGELQTQHNVKPFYTNIKQIPVPGELVLIFLSIDHKSTSDNDDAQWYYMPSPMSISSNINNNILPTVTDEFEQDEKFEQEKYTVSTLQPYRGDLMLEGRFGNSIRFSSTIDFKQDYSLPGKWSGNKNGDPILVLSNGREYKEDKQFVTEDINTDKSSLYLTSTQKLPLSLGSKNQPNSLTGAVTSNGTETNYIGSQLVGVSDRVILKARTDLAVIDSPVGIVLNSTGEIKLGSEDASESMVHGEVLFDILQNILNQLRTVVQCGSASGTFINLSYAERAQRQLQELLSSKYFINKNTY